MAKIEGIGSYTEWQPLREIVVGRVDGACWPDWNTVDAMTISDELRAEVTSLRGHWRSYPRKVIEGAQACLDCLLAILKAEGIKVHRPDFFSHSAPYETPHWRVANGFCSANPRDVILPVGQTFIECPMAHRGRFFETLAYRRIMQQLMRRGALWLAAPKPALTDSLYDTDYVYPPDAPEEVGDDWDSVDPDALRFITTEVEPVFDAADFVRCGRDIFGQRSQVTNLAGIDWLKRLVEPEYRVHLIPTRCAGAYHIDTSFLPLAPGKVLVNPDFIDVNKLPEALRHWDILEAPAPRSMPIELNGWMSDWISMNVLSLDEKRIIVERDQQDLITALRSWGFDPIPCRFKEHYPFLGGFHCATLDIWREGPLEDYS